MSLTLKELAKYWSEAGDSDYIIPYKSRLSYEDANSLGKSILEFIKRIEAIEATLEEYKNETR